jgi:hypothetical protein
MAGTPFGFICEIIFSEKVDDESFIEFLNYLFGTYF